ncbi:MAG: UTP--glucose-1-phosphate uridylyltransferase [Rickettsiales bacterium]|jgi:UTP--glucose-1-phosphate uridylyltransferase
MKRIRKAVFPVGGLGTRFLPATKSIPKEMLPVANKPLIQYAFEEARDAGIEEFIFVTGRNKNAINNHFDHAYELQSTLDEKGKAKELKEVKSWLPHAGQVAFVRQQEPLGLGHAIWCARNFVGDEPFVVILADEMVLNENNLIKSMIDLQHSKEADSSIVAVATVAADQVNKYGIISADYGSKKIIDMVEKPAIGQAPSNLAINGRYILQPKIFEYLAKAGKGTGGEIQLTDAMKLMAKDYPFYYQNYDGIRFDCGNVLGFLEANIAFALKNPAIKNDFLTILKKYV